MLEMHAVPPYLEGAAGTALTESGDAVQIVGGDGLILLFDEAESREVETGLLAIPVLHHGGELIYGAPFNKSDHLRSVLMIKERQFKTKAPFGFRGSFGALIAWKRRKPVDMCNGLNLKSDH